ncbi:HAD-IC family P-type ATPase [Blastochloris sulfoviridis]|uniref:HAD-IC family P-type ATPase n=1 Tax=Blastochloris sulfoviridis TaxID=50712 RepID=A0A5M6HQW6_9HYPH|nr:HAD-IC family P-type ATPase [Blastochloris sulfoviridis]KAA5598117.1 HAD-IC family P-type ATPase [Blastochloris sulfoviridis]
MNQGNAAPPAWHALDAADCLTQLDSRTDGLTAAEAASRLAADGPNRLPEAPRRGALVRFALQVHNLLIYVLLASALVSLLLGHLLDSLVILIVVVLNAVIGFLQEGKAERALEAIRAMIDPKVTVLREGVRRSIAAEEVVRGDIVLLEAGDRVPADLRLMRSRNLRIDEAILTGESVPVEKATDPVAAAAPLAERAAMAYSGTLVTGGQASGLVVAAGAATELGRISRLLGAVEELKTPLIAQMDRFARQITLVVLGVSAAAFVFAVLLRGYAMTDAFMAMVGLAVAAIPEGLPAVMTITLAVGVQRMAGRNAIIRRLPAVETLGSVSVICSDKTGTLTRNEMTVRAVVTANDSYEVSGAGYVPAGAFTRAGIEIDPAQDGMLAELVRAAVLCNDAETRETEAAWLVDGDPMEGALVVLGAKSGLDVSALRKAVPRTDEIPFDAAHRFMATLHHDHEGNGFIFVKGAPERILDMAHAARTMTGERPLDRAAWSAQADDLAAQGQRVLAFATKPAGACQQSLTFADVEDGLVLLGLVGFIDPPREEAIAAVAECQSAGIRVVMITGDHAITAREIGQQLGLARAPVVRTGEEVDRLDEADLAQAVRETTVFARTTPEHKLRLVSALQAQGLTVAMTGDGVNDAPALKRADVGVAMGCKGTEASKQAAEMVLADDNFASIVAAVKEGRTVYDNLRKVIGWTLPTNGGQAATILGAIAMGWTLPITPVQILWVNMVSAVALGMTLAFEPAEPGSMARPPRRRDAPLVSGELAWQILLVTILFAIFAFGMFFWAGQRGLPIEEARTIVVNTIVVLEIFYLFSVRYVHGPSLTWQGVLGTKAVLIGVGVTVLAQLAFTYAPPFNAAFETRPMSLLDAAAILGAGVLLLVVLETEKLLRKAATNARPGG